MSSAMDLDKPLDEVRRPFVGEQPTDFDIRSSRQDPKLAEDEEEAPVLRRVPQQDGLALRLDHLLRLNLSPAKLPKSLSVICQAT